MAKCNWEPFFEEFTDILLNRYDNKEIQDLIRAIREMYSRAGIADVNIPVCGRDAEAHYIAINNRKVCDIDPLTILVFILDTPEDIKKKCDAIAEIFDMKNRFPDDYDGSGIPLSEYPQKLFSWYREPDEYSSYPSDTKQRNYLWALFGATIALRKQYSDENRTKFIELFNEYHECVKDHMTKTFLATDRLMLAAPNVLISLNECYNDVVSKRYPKVYEMLPDNRYNEISGEDYLAICEELVKELKGKGKTLSDFVYEVQVPDASKEIVGTNTIYYGIPGCGKSHYVDECVLEGNKDRAERIVFHPDYTYSDFVGQILPVMHDGVPVYQFQAGPFTRILKRAINDRSHEYFLVIEEINRGNAPAIFGDIFQLLDRNKENGESEYSIENADIADAVYQDKDSRIKIPSNLSIVCTMNTADQNVFTLDTAFQRRFEMHYIKDEPGDADDIDKVVIGSGDLSTGIKWKTFHDSINREISNKSTYSGSDDKRLGYYFCTRQELEKLDLFVNKVIKYLWDDTFKIRRSDVFADGVNTFEEIVNKFNGDKLKGSKDTFFGVFKEGTIK